MDVKSFEYQTAMQQITGQEQGEADNMLKVFHGVWFKEYYPIVWDWIGGIYFTLLSLLLIVFGITWIEES